jgi:hypothetical protein
MTTKRLIRTVAIIVATFSTSFIAAGVADRHAVDQREGAQA